MPRLDASLTFDGPFIRSASGSQTEAPPVSAGTRGSARPRGSSAHTTETGPLRGRRAPRVAASWAEEDAARTLSCRAVPRPSPLAQARLPSSLTEPSRRAAEPLPADLAAKTRPRAAALAGQEWPAAAPWIALWGRLGRPVQRG